MNLIDHYNYVKQYLANEQNERPFINFVINEIEKLWKEKRVFIIRAPTGYGKTSISLTIASYSEDEEIKCIVAYPLRSLIEDQFHNFFKKVFKEEKKLGMKYMYESSSPYLIKPITLTTIDTLSLVIFGIAPEDLNKTISTYLGTGSGTLGHYLFSRNSFINSNLVLDEVHLVTDTTKSLNFLLALLKIAIYYDQKVLLMSATLPDSFREIIESVLDNKEKEKIKFLDFNNSFDSEFVKERASKNYLLHIEGLRKEEKFEKIFNQIKKSDFKRTIIIFNTYKDSVEFFLKYKDALVNEFENVVLLHSKFNAIDRDQKVKIIKEFQDKEKFVIISTQVIEAGFDISCTHMVTELAPINSLLQRMGRFLRREEKNGEVYIWYEINEYGDLLCQNEKKEKVYKVYDFELVKRTLYCINKYKDRLSFHIPNDYANKIGYLKLIGEVYDKSYFKYDYEKILKMLNNQYTLKKTTKEALDLFFELEGSFVRNGYIVPILPLSLLNEDGTASIENIVPIEFNEFNMLMKKDSEMIKNKNKPKYLKGIIRIEEQKIETSAIEEFLGKNTYNTIQSLIRYIARKRVLAFVLDLKYSKDIGLILYDDL